MAMDGLCATHSYPRTVICIHINNVTTVHFSLTDRTDWASARTDRAPARCECWFDNRAAVAAGSAANEVANSAMLLLMLLLAEVGWRVD